MPYNSSSPSKSLSNYNIVITGGSRDIGGGIVLELAKAGATTTSIFRSHADRAQKISDTIKNSGGIEPTLIQADLTTEQGRSQVFTNWKEKYQNKIDVLVLCASGATREINVDANMALIDKLLALRKDQLKNTEQLSPATIIFLQSEPGHYQRVIDGVFDFLAYYREKVGPAKRAGEDALRERLHLMETLGVRAIIVCPPEVEDTFNMKLFELQNKEARKRSRELSAKLGTQPFVNISQVAQKVRELIEDTNIPNGHIELFGNVTDGLTQLSKIYGDQAIYVHTFEKIDENKGIGRVIVSPSIWKRDEEPSFSGEITKKDKKNLTTILTITKDHMPGHFRHDIAYLFPGHKSIRAAAIALGKFLETDNPANPEKIYLSKYNSVKFRSPVAPGQTITTKITLTQKTKNTATGDAISSVNDKETIVIKGMQVKIIKSPTEESVLLLDQLVEAAAQTVGLYVLKSLKNEPVLPLFHSTGEAEIFKSIQAGDNLLLKSNNLKIIKSKSMNIFSGDLQIYRKTTNEELIAEIKNLQGLLLPKEEVLKKLSNTVPAINTSLTT